MSNIYRTLLSVLFLSLFSSNVLAQDYYDYSGYYDSAQSSSASSANTGMGMVADSTSMDSGESSSAYSDSMNNDYDPDEYDYEAEMLAYMEYMNNCYQEVCITNNILVYTDENGTNYYDEYTSCDYQFVC